MTGVSPFPSFMKVSVLPFNGLFEIAKDASGAVQITGGLEAEYLQILSTSLNFGTEVVPPPDGEWGRKTANGSWTGLVGMVLRGDAQLALGGIAVTETRAQVVHYTLPYRFTYLAFATHPPPQLPRFATVLYPFTAHLWIALGVLLLAMPLVFRLLLRKKTTLADHFLDTVKSLVYEPMATPRDGSAGDYFLLGAWLVSAMVLTYSYAATLLSFLTIPLYEAGVRDIQELSLLVARGKYKAGCFKGTNVANILRASHHASIARMADHILSNGHDIEPNLQSVENFYREGNPALIAPEIYFSMNFPRLRIAPEALKCTAIAMVTPKTFCCKEVLDRQIGRIFESGLSQQIVRRVQTRIEIKNSVSGTVADEKIVALNLEDFLGAFLLLLAGIVVSVVALIVEIVVSSNKPRKAYR